MRKLLLVGAAVVAAGIFLKRDKVAGLLPSRTEPYSPPSPAPSNYDAPGPVANTATPVPAPEPRSEPAAVDEAAEEAAAAAEAANIGGTVSDYAGPEPTCRPTEAERPLAEAGEGEAEGQEQAELDLETAAEPYAPGMSDAERQIDDAIEQAANPLAGEQVEPVRPATSRRLGPPSARRAAPFESAAELRRRPADGRGARPRRAAPSEPPRPSRRAPAAEGAPPPKSPTAAADEPGRQGRRRRRLGLAGPGPAARSTRKAFHRSIRTDVGRRRRSRPAQPTITRCTP